MRVARGSGSGPSALHAAHSNGDPCFTRNTAPHALRRLQTPKNCLDVWAQGHNGANRPMLRGEIICRIYFGDRKQFNPSLDQQQYGVESSLTLYSTAGPSHLAKEGPVSQLGGNVLCSNLKQSIECWRQSGKRYEYLPGPEQTCDAL